MTQYKTWGDYIDAKARALGVCRNATELQRELDDIDNFISTHNAPADFWEQLKESYERAPKLILKEAAAAAALNALVASAQAIISARASSK